jgi:hypothetical protein
MDAAIKVEGLDDLRRELRKLDAAGLTNELKEANYRVAQSVIGPAQSRARGLGAMETKAANTLKASRAAKAALINYGGARAPFAGGAEFGAHRDLRRRRGESSYVGFRQFAPWTGNGMTAGRFIYPTIRDMTPGILDEYGEEIGRITAKAFPH